VAARPGHDRRGEEIAVVIDIVDYRHLKGDIAEFKDYLRSGPDFDDLDLSRAGEGPRIIEWAGEE
jgi:hypothetical protein